MKSPYKIGVYKGILIILRDRPIQTSRVKLHADILFKHGINRNIATNERFYHIGRESEAVMDRVKASIDEINTLEGWDKNGNY